ncbi:hypothetical protein M8C21_007141 [Ambrosia artemisiifolia]|uniref:Uncharacterized protein n=1 Tax=Ambrosia artemisiifolia TaxID=4212 RepID=A0AAD5CHH9_AMBAR|nr:hypothetical protein M8C21_007141 [Ambrosia artemisiifolia]
MDVDLSHHIAKVRPTLHKVSKFHLILMLSGCNLDYIEAYEFASTNLD